LLVVEIGVGPASGARPGHELVRAWPSYLAYVTSFVTIGIIWINHHHNMRAIGRVDRAFMFVNLLLLLVAFIPFPTKLVADYLQREGESVAVIAYGATLLVMAYLYTVWRRYARTGRRLIAPTVADAEPRAIDRGFAPGLPAYAACSCCNAHRDPPRPPRPHAAGPREAHRRDLGDTGLEPH
jgi:TMEM175 potassium channel family protein